VKIRATREQLRQESRRALQQAAIELVDRHGFAPVTVVDIALAGGVSRRTFFNHFPTKAAVLFDPDPEDADRLAELLADADGTANLWSSLRTVCRAFVAGHESVIFTRRRLVAESPELDQYHRTAHHHVEVTLDEWARRQRPSDPFAATLLAQTAAAVLTSAFAAWLPDDDPALLLDLVDRGFDLVTSGFAD
jgi:AcrR family transcriptional regulator